MSTPASVSFNRIKKEDPVPCSPCSPSSSVPASTTYMDTTTVGDREILNSSPLTTTSEAADHRLGEILMETGSPLHCCTAALLYCTAVHSWVVVFTESLDAGEVVFARDRD